MFDLENTLDTERKDRFADWEDVEVRAQEIGDYDVIRRMSDKLGMRLKHSGAQAVMSNPRRPDAKMGSLGFNLHSRQWAEHSPKSGTGGGKGVVSLWRYLRGVKFTQACEEMAEIVELPEASDRAGNVFETWRNTAVPADDHAPEQSKEGPVVPVPDAAAEKVPVENLVGEPEVMHPYLTAEGQLACLLCRVRTGGDKIIVPLTYWRTAEGKHEWRKKHLPHSAPLYHADKLAEHDRLPVVITEGEGGADAVNECGAAAVGTTWLGGAKSAAGAKWEQLRGRTVILAPDNDAEGKEAMRLVADRLGRIDCSVSWLPIPQGKREGWDIGDEEPYAVRRLVGPCLNASVSSDFDLDDWSLDAIGAETEPGAIEFAVRGMFPMGRVSVLAGDGGVGKTHLMLDLAYRVASGKGGTFLGADVEQQGKVVYISAEDGKDDLVRRLHAHAGSGAALKGLPLILLPFLDMGSVPPLVRRTSEGVQASPTLRSVTEKAPGAKLIIVDGLTSTCPGIDQNTAGDTQSAMNAFAELAAQSGAAVVVLHHVAKTPADMRLSGLPELKVETMRQFIKGSNQIVNMSRSSVVLWHPSGKEVSKKWPGVHRTSVVISAVGKANFPGAASPCRLRLTDQGYEPLDEPEPEAETPDADPSDALVAAISEAAKPFTRTGKSGVHERRNELPAPLDTFSRRRLHDLVDRLIAEGRIRRDEEGRLSDADVDGVER